MNPYAKIIGHQEIIGVLERSLAAGKLSHAYLFTGPAGVGKRTVARAFATAILAEGGSLAATAEKLEHSNHPDLLELAPEEGNNSLKIAAVRTLMEGLAIKPHTSLRRVIIIAAAETMTVDAQNALLKSLEEPDPHNLFILTATRPEGVLATIRSRCQHFELGAVSDAEIVEFLQERGYTGSAVEGAIFAAGGSPGQALSFLEDEELEKQQRDVLTAFCQLVEGRRSQAFGLAEQLAADPVVCREMLMFLIRILAELDEERRDSGQFVQETKRLQESLDFGEILRIQDIFWELLTKLEYNINLRLQLEGALLRI